MSAPDIILTEDQDAALAEIKAAYRHGQTFLLTGNAGSGKTTLTQKFTKDMLALKRQVILTAPTHKAVSVLARKVAEAGIRDAACCTIHSLLSLKPKPYGDRLTFHRDKWAQPITADIVVVDECSMVSEELYRHIKRHLPMAFVLFVGDPAQLPPVGEVESQTFGTKNKTSLTTIVRQAAGNPILEAASTIRLSQGNAADWSWCKKAALDTGMGVFTPNGSAQRWMQKAFTSPDFDADPDTFRYLAWTNRRVDEINTLVRRWRYGNNIPTPFMPGEMAMFRAPLVIDKTIVFATNEEARVLAIEPALYTHAVPRDPMADGWEASLPAWRIRLRRSDGMEQTVFAPSSDREFQKIIARIKDEAAEAKIRWKHLHVFQSGIAKLQSIYALTTHCSQGSTFQNSFVDVPDIRKRESTNLKEMQQMLYVAATRASHRLILVGT